MGVGLAWDGGVVGEEGADGSIETAELGHGIGAGPMPETAGVIGEAREPLARGEIEFGAVVRDARRIPQRIGLDRAARGKVAVDLPRAYGDRTSDVMGQRVHVRVDSGGRSIIIKTLNHSKKTT